MKVAIFYLCTGVGHFREALAISKALKELAIEAELINLDETLKNSRSLRLKFLYFTYYIGVYLFKITVGNKIALSTRPLEHSDLFSTLSVKSTIYWFSFYRYFVKNILKTELNLDSYAAYISIHPLATRLISKSINPSKYLLNVCPDEIGASAAHFYAYKHCVNTVNSLNAEKKFLQIGIAQSRVKVLGHPLDPQILNNREKIYNRVQSSLKSGELNLGLYIGGFAPKSQQDAIIRTIEELASVILTGSIKIHVLTGNHIDFERKLVSTLNALDIKDKVDVSFSKSFEDIVRVGHKWMEEDINIMFSRPSELVFYSLATGIPHVTFLPLGPQEVDMLYLLKSAGATTYTDITGSLVKYITDTDKLLQLSKNLFYYDYNVSGSQNIAMLIKNEIHNNNTYTK